MKLIKNVFFISVLFFVVILTGCSKSDEDLFNETYENMSKQNNFKMEMKVEVAANDINVDTEVDMQFDMESDTEGAIKYSFTLEGMTLNGYIDMNNENITSYINFLGTWVKNTESVSEYEDESYSSDVFINDLKYNN